MESRARAQLLVKVQGRGKAAVLGPSAHAVNDPRAESRLQGLCFEEGGQIFPRGLFEKHFKVGHVHVAVEARCDDVLARLTEHFVAEVRTKVVHDAGALVVGVSPVDVFVGHGREGVESFVLHVAFFQHKLLVVLDQIHKGLVSVFPLHEEVAAVFCGPFLQPHVVVDGGGHQVAPPVVSQFVGEQVSVGEVALLHHEPGVGNVGGNFEGAVGGQHVADALPGVGPPPVLQGVNGEAEVGEFGLHGVDVSRLAREPNRDGSVFAFVLVVVVDVWTHGHGAQVRGDGMVQRPGGPDGVAAQRDLLDEVALVVGPSSARAGDVVGVGGAFHKVVEARVPHLAEVGWDGGQADAQVVDQVAGVVHPAPVGVVVGLPSIPNLQLHRFTFRHGSWRIDVEFRPCLFEGHRVAVPVHTVDGQALEVPPHRGSPALKHREIDGGQGLHGLSGIVRHVQHQIVVHNVKAVTARDARPHVVVVDGQHPQRRTVLRAPRGVTSLNKEGGAHGAFVLVEAGDGRGLG